MIICICRDIKTSDFEGGKITQEQYTDLIKDVECGACIDCFKKCIIDEKDKD